METMVPWLLLVIAGLIVACAVMHSRLRETESATRGQQSVIADELREAEAALVSALDRLRRMDQELSARESNLSRQLWEPPPPQAPPRLSPVLHPQDLPSNQASVPSEHPSLTVSWRARAIDLARQGLTPLQIARELELPTGEVELVLALDTR